MSSSAPATASSSTADAASAAEPISPANGATIGTNSATNGANLPFGGAQPKASLVQPPMPDYTPNPTPAGSRIWTEFPQIVYINVGGVRLMTTLETLRADPGSMLGRMFSGEHPCLRDDDGHFVIDRDGRHFHLILNYLRDGSVPIGLSRVARVELLRELDFYGIKPLYTILGGPVVAAASASGHMPGPWLQGLTYELARAEAVDFQPKKHSHRIYARLRYGVEYSGDWIVSSPRNLPGVEYELYDACLARDPITALNRMGGAGFLPCVDPPDVPPSTRCHSDTWEIMLFKDVKQ